MVVEGFLKLFGVYLEKLCTSIVVIAVLLQGCHIELSSHHQSQWISKNLLHQCFNGPKMPKLQPFTEFCGCQLSFFGIQWAQIFVVFQIFSNYRVLGWSWNFWEFHWQFTYDELTIFSNHFVNSLNDAICSDRLLSLILFIMDISSTIIKLSAPFMNNTITHKVVSIHLTHSSVNF